MPGLPRNIVFDETGQVHSKCCFSFYVFVI